ncbi:hypothetical protein M0812_11405 [Anaeramoeba flamelloides]|uniref:Uncharacterized protein n=1 Tax=Anaeramoeba flamelloides TaxID=1746091 RepID=A0AAV7ZVA3_9EUKA|nr:hypothetical protein M0812_11405 [Anaeramoeba flamelloides]
MHTLHNFFDFNLFLSITFFFLFNHPKYKKQKMVNKKVIVFDKGYENENESSDENESSYERENDHKKSNEREKEISRIGKEKTKKKSKKDIKVPEGNNDQVKEKLKKKKKL